MNGNSSDVTDLSETLVKATFYGNKELLESLLENGADPNIPISNGNYPLHEAAQSGETECASILLAHKGERFWPRGGHKVAE